MRNGGAAWALLWMTAICRPVCADSLEDVTGGGQLAPTLQTGELAAPDFSLLGGRFEEAADALPLSRLEGVAMDPSWLTLDPERDRALRSARSTRSTPAPVGGRELLPLAALLGLGACALCAIVLGRLQRWSPAAIQTFLERTGTPWGRREDLFLEKLILELRILRATELSTQLAMEGDFAQLDAIERPLRRMRRRFRSVRREYRHIEQRIGPVSAALREDCAQAMRRSGILDAPALSQQEVVSMQRITSAIDRHKRELNRTP